jgi:hypothetical protein
MSSYVKFLQDQGAKVVPLLNRAGNFTEDLDQLNGVLMPGGSGGDGMTTIHGKQIFDYIK